MSKGLSDRQCQIYEFIDGRSRQGWVTTSLDIVEKLFPHRIGDGSFRKSIWRSLVSLERRGWIQVYSLAPGQRERGARGVIRYIRVNERDRR